MKRICLLVNNNTYFTARHFTTKLAEALERNGAEVSIIEVGRAITPELIERIQNASPVYTGSFSMIPPMSESIQLWDITEIPHLTFLIDPAIYSLSLTQSSYSYIGCVDHDDAAALKSFGFEQAFFFPHAVEQELTSTPIDCERPYETVFFGSCYDYENLEKYWKEQLPKSAQNVLNSAIARAKNNSLTPLSEALAGACEAHRTSYSGSELQTLYYFLDGYLRGVDRVGLIRAAAQIAPVQVWGGLYTELAGAQNSWEYYLAGSNAVTHPSIPFPETLGILKQSKVALNSSPFFRNGSHERFFYALACGAVPITTLSRYLLKDFEESLFYPACNWKRAAASIDQILNDPQQLHSLALDGQQTVRELHTWDQRARLITLRFFSHGDTTE